MHRVQWRFCRSVSLVPYNLIALLANSGDDRLNLVQAFLSLLPDLFLHDLFINNSRDSPGDGGPLIQEVGGRSARRVHASWTW